MLEKLQYDLENDTYVQDLPEVASLSSKNKESLNKMQHYDTIHSIQ